MLSSDGKLALKVGSLISLCVVLIMIGIQFASPDFDMSKIIATIFISLPTSFMVCRAVIFVWRDCCSRY